MLSELKDIINEFQEESLELLNQMEDSLLAIQNNGMNDEDINSVFRAAHTIKGTAGMFKIGYLVDFTHVAENLLDNIRSNKTKINEEIINLLLQSKDHMFNLINHTVTTVGEGDLSEDLKDGSSTLITQLAKYIKEENGSTVKQAPQKQEVVVNPNEANWKISLFFTQEVYEHGMDPAHFIRFLNKIGKITDINTMLTDIPSLLELKPTSCYLSFEIILSTDKSQKEIEDVFEFVRDDCRIEIKKIENEPIVLSNNNNDDNTEDEEKVTKLELKSRERDKEAQTLVAKSLSIRVDAEKIDNLINLIGEMVIANANVIQKAIDLQDSELLESVSMVSRMLEEVRESAMKVRMVQIGDTFNRFKRIVHDVSAKLGKDIDLIINGGDTELDKTVTEKITDPLVHIVRNAIDHGIEGPEERIKKGKNPKGRLQLNAYHDAGTIAIEIIDDGKGLDEEKIISKAIEKGLIEDGLNIPQKEVFKLILEPGFSTASQVTDLSGRGVGMDVVKRNIEALRGNIEIRSEKNKGSSFIIRLPLTLAIIDGFLVKVGKIFYVIPLEMVVECIELTEEFKRDMHGNNYINLRGTILPLLDVRRYFDEEGEKVGRENIVVVQYAGQKFGLIVDELHGEFQTVIKPLGKIFRDLRGLSGATILGSGAVALILDIPVLTQAINAIIYNQSRANLGGRDDLKTVS